MFSKKIWQHLLEVQHFLFPQVVPILLQLVKAISSVRLYIPKDLRSLDSRQSVGKSVKVGT